MSSSESNLSEETKYDFKNILTDEKNDLCNLKMQSEAYDLDTVDTDGDEFQPNQKNSSWEKEIENYYKQALNEKTDIIKEKIEKLGKFSIMQHEWELEKTKLQNTIDCITSELKSYSSKENLLMSKLEEYNELLKCNQSKYEEKKCEVEKLYAEVKTNEEELSELRVKFDEYKKENCRLVKENTELVENLKCAETELSVANTEENIKNNLLEKLKAKCEELNDIHTLYEETKCQLDVEKDKVKDLVATLVDGNKSSENNNAECITGENNNCICQLKNKIEVLQRDNGLPSSEFSDNKTNCRLEQIVLYADKLYEFKRKCENIGLLKKNTTIIDQCCENANATVLNRESDSEPNNSGDCYTEKLKQLSCELDDLREEANLITNQ